MRAVVKPLSKEEQDKINACDHDWADTHKHIHRCTKCSLNRLSQAARKALNIKDEEREN